jgi:hypothetical protein
MIGGSEKCARHICIDSAVFVISVVPGIHIQKENPAACDGERRVFCFPRRESQVSAHMPAKNTLCAWAARAVVSFVCLDPSFLAAPNLCVLPANSGNFRITQSLVSSC